MSNTLNRPTSGRTLCLPRSFVGLAPSIAFTLCLPIVGCGGSRLAEDRPAPPPSFVTAATRATARSHDIARTAAASLDAWEVPARRNDAGCDCPPWEIFIEGAWRRVELRPRADAEVPSVLAAPLTPRGPDPTAGATLASAPSPVVRVRIALRSEWVEGVGGWRYPVVDLLPPLAPDP